MGRSKEISRMDEERQQDPREQIEKYQGEMDKGISQGKKLNIITNLKTQFKERIHHKDEGKRVRS